MGYFSDFGDWLQQDEWNNGTDQQDYKGTSEIGSETTFGAISSGLGIMGGLMKNDAEQDMYTNKADSLKWQASRYKYKSKRADLAAEQTKQQTVLNTTLLQEQYNDVQEQQIVKFAIQGRTGATIDNLISQDQEQLNWDKEYMEASGRIEELDYRLDSAGYRVDDARARLEAYDTQLAGRKASNMNAVKTAVSVATIV